MNNSKIMWLAVIVVAIIAVCGLVRSGQGNSHRLGGVTNFDTLQAQTMKIGTSTGVSNLSFVTAGTCNLLGMDVAQSASTTRPYDCAVTGVISGDVVLVLNSTTTASYNTLTPFRISGARASTTANFITFGLENSSGQSLVPSAVGTQNGFGSSTPYIIFRTQTGTAGI